MAQQALSVQACTPLSKAGCSLEWSLPAPRILQDIVTSLETGVVEWQVQQGTRTSEEPEH